MYEGAFKAVMKNGHIGIFRRRCEKSLPIDKIKIESCKCEIVKKRAESEVEGAFEKHFQQQVNYITKYVLGNLHQATCTTPKKEISAIQT